MPSIVTSDFQIYREPAAAVYVSDDLRDQDFTLVSYLRCNRLRITAGPEIDQAELSYLYGDIEREDQNTVSTYTPLDLDGKFVKIVIKDTIYPDYSSSSMSMSSSSGSSRSSNAPITDESITWFGIIEHDERDADGTNSAGHQTGSQRFYAFGLMRLLEKQQIRTSIVDVDGTLADAFTAPAGITFNQDPGGAFINRGNRTATRISNGSSSSSAGGIEMPFVFSWEPRGQNKWTAFTAIEYLLYFHSPKKSDQVTAANVWRLDADVDALDWYDISEKTDGRNVKQLIDALIPRQRAVGYWVDFDITRSDPADPTTAANQVVIHVFTFLNTNLTLPDGEILEANPNQYSLDFEHAYDIEKAEIGNTSLQRYHRVIVRGAKRTCTFTAQIKKFVDHQTPLTTSWTSAQETEYKNGANAAADYAALTDDEKRIRNAVYRSSDRLREVFRRFRLNTEKSASDRWSCQIWGAPHDTTKTDHYWIRGDQTASTFSPIVDPGSSYIGLDHVPGMRILRHLPLYERADYSGANLSTFSYSVSITDETHPSFIPLLAYARTTVGNADVANITVGQLPHRYEMLDRLHQKAFDAQSNRDWSCRIHVADTEPGFELVADVPHFLDGIDAGKAGAGYALTSDAQMSYLHGGIDYTNVWCTLCAELTEHLESQQVLSEPPTNAPENIKVINVPDARHDYVLPYTTVEIKDGLPVPTTSGGFARDDTARVRKIAAAAAQWYSTNRQTLNLKWKQVRASFQLGWLITFVGSYTVTGINTPVTAITYDLGDDGEPGSTGTGSTSIETAFAELDLQR